jgi:hypothetical protein
MVAGLAPGMEAGRFEQRADAATWPGEAVIGNAADQSFPGIGPDQAEHDA